MFQKSLKLVLALNILALLSCGSDDSSSLNPRNPLGDGPAPVSLSPNGGSVQSGDLGAAGNYVILAKSGVSNVTGSNITGKIGISPAAASLITGFGLMADASNEFSTSSSVTGRVYAANYSTPTPSNLTTAISNMETAYNDAAGRTPADRRELATGNLGGLTLAPNLYNWTNTVTIPTNVTISGGANDVWIFQIAGDLTMAAATDIILAGGARAENIFWQVAGQVTIGTTSQFHGIILGKTSVILDTNAVLNGRIYAQTAVVLDDNAITEQ